MSSQHLSDYDKKLLADGFNTCIVKIKGKGAGAETMMPILKTTWAKMQKEQPKDAADWKEITPTSTVKLDQTFVPQKTPQEIMEEAMGEIKQPIESEAKDSEIPAKKGKATKSV